MTLSPTSPCVDWVVLLDNMDAESRERLREDAESVYGSPWGLALRDFFALAKRDLSFFGLTKDTALKMTVRQYVWLKWFDEVCEQVVNILHRLTAPQSDTARKASEQLLKVGFDESTLVFVRKYFGLKNFTEAESITLADFILARKDHYNDCVFKYYFNDIQRQQFKKR